MAFIDQAKQILEGAAGATLTNARMLQAVKDYLRLPDDTALTNEQIAEEFVTDVRRRMKAQIRAGAMFKVEEANRATVTEAGDTAETGL